MLSGVDCWSLIPSIPTTVRAFIFSIIILTHNSKAIEINGPINKYGVRKCQTGWSFIATALEIQLILLTKHLSTVKMNAMHSRSSRFVQFTKWFLILKSVNCVQHLNTINNNNANVHRYILVRANVMCTHMCSKKAQRMRVSIIRIVCDLFFFPSICLGVFCAVWIWIERIVCSLTWWWALTNSKNTIWQNSWCVKRNMKISFDM